MIRRLSVSVMLLACFVAPLWSQTYKISHLGGEVNTKGSETGATIVDDSLMIYASHDSYGDLLMELRRAPIDASGLVGAGVRLGGVLSSKQFHMGNAAYDARNDVLYFTRCAPDEDDVINCEIMCSKRVKGRFQRPQRLGGTVNLSGSTSTHPAVAYQADGSVILYFSSNRPGGLGGMDIWYTVLRDGRPGSCSNLGTPVNSENDEITPFYHRPTSSLYFSSNRDGIGGYDVYASRGERDSWSFPVALPAPLNSEYNDVYFMVADSTNQWGFLASNRKDSFFATDSSCCNDLYQWRIVEEPEPVDTVTVDVQRPAQPPHTKKKSKKRDVPQNDAIFPIMLYFHNDEPDPRSQSATTGETYFQTYNKYMFRRNEYKEAWNGVADSIVRDSIWNAIDDFFDNEVAFNCDKFEVLLSMVYDDLRSGRRVALTVTGYASPLHTEAYNDLLSRRRISCILNQMAAWRGGLIRSFVEDGSLIIKQEPYGCSRAQEANSVFSDFKKTGAYGVYSIDSAKERRIEILNYFYF